MFFGVFIVQMCTLFEDDYMMQELISFGGIRLFVALWTAGPEWHSQAAAAPVTRWARVSFVWLQSFLLYFNIPLCLIHLFQSHLTVLIVPQLKDVFFCSIFFFLSQLHHVAASLKWKLKIRSLVSASVSLFFIFYFLVGAKEGTRELFDDPSYVNVDKPRPPLAANGNANRDAFDMSECLPC